MQLGKVVPEMLNCTASTEGDAPEGMCLGAEDSPQHGTQKERRLLCLCGSRPSHSLCCTSPKHRACSCHGSLSTAQESPSDQAATRGTHSASPARSASRSALVEGPSTGLLHISLLCLWQNHSRFCQGRR